MTKIPSREVKRISGDAQVAGRSPGLDSVRRGRGASMQEGAPPDMLFPVDADQAHYLTVMTNRWRWRTPSPGYDSSDRAPSPASSPASSPLKPSSSRSSTASPSAGLGPTHPRTRPALAVATPDLDGVALTRCGLVVGEGEGVPLGDGQIPSPTWAGIEAGDGDTKAGADEASGGSEAALALALEATRRDDDEDDDDGGAGGMAVDVVVSLDSSRAASLTRTCKWAGYKKVKHASCGGTACVFSLDPCSSSLSVLPLALSVFQMRMAVLTSESM